jgi:hypothetical protein
MTEIQKAAEIFLIGHLVIGIYLACLREAASAKAGIWNLSIGI